MWSLWGRCEALSRGRAEEETAKKDEGERAHLELFVLVSWAVYSVKRSETYDFRVR